MGRRLFVTSASLVAAVLFVVNVNSAVAQKKVPPPLYVYVDSSPTPREIGLAVVAGWSSKVLVTIGAIEVLLPISPYGFPDAVPTPGLYHDDACGLPWTALFVGLRPDNPGMAFEAPVLQGLAYLPNPNIHIHYTAVFYKTYDDPITKLRRCGPGEPEELATGGFLSVQRYDLSLLGFVPPFRLERR